MATGTINMTGYKAKYLSNSFGSATLPVYFDAGVPKTITSYQGNAATATQLASAGTTAQFYRGDRTWSNTLTGDLTVNGTSRAKKFLYEWTAASNQPMLVLLNAETYGLRYHEGDVDKMMLSASGNADSANADFCINGNGDGTLSNRGNRIPHTGNTTGSVGGATNPVYIDGGQIKAISAGQTYQFYRGDKVWSDTLVGQAPYLTVKTNDAAYYAVFRLATQSNGEAAVLFLNNTSRSGDGGANTLTLRNNVGNLRLNNNTYNTGTFTVGDAVQTSYKFKVSGTSYLDGDTRTQKLLLRRSESENYGRISFYDNGYVTWFMYMTPAGAASPTSKAAPSYGGVSSWAIHSLIENAANYGWIWESCTNSSSSTPDAKMALRADTGELTIKSQMYVNGSNRVLYTSYGTAIAGFRNQAGSNQAYYWGFNGGSSETYAVPNSSMSVGYASSAGAVARATFGDSGNATHDANAMTSNGMYYYNSNGPATSLGASTTDGSIYCQAYNTTWVSQIAQDYRNGSLFVRGKNNGTWQAWRKVWIKGDSITNAVWNDLAECRKSITHDPGYIITPFGSLASERLEPGCRIISDTWGFLLGNEENKDQAPVAITGRVLAYPYKNKSEYKIGDAVCSAPGGTIDVMTREEIMMYPDRIIGIVNEIPDYDIWEPSLIGGGANQFIPTEESGQTLDNKWLLCYLAA